MARNTLTPEQIVRVATRLLDEDGIEGLSMRKLGAALGSGATSIYWHVTSREKLILLAADQVWSEIPLPDADEIGWRAAAASIASDTYAMLTRHLWLVPAFGNQVLYGEGLAAYEEHCYKVYEAAGFSGRELDWAVNTVFTFVLGTALGDAAASAVASDGNPADDQRAAIGDVEVAARIVDGHPRLRGRRDAYLGEDPRRLQSESLVFGVETILDGLAARLDRSDSAQNG
ncbi:MAG: TetR/AcrR family transcriptional regulator [Agromyces sp.]